MAVMTTSTITAPKTDPITIAAISPPERSLSLVCESGASAVTSGITGVPVTLGMVSGVAVTLEVSVTLGVTSATMTVLVVTTRVGVLGDIVDDGVTITSKTICLSFKHDTYHVHMYTHAYTYTHTNTHTTKML